MKKEKKENKFIKSPVYEGGIKAMRAFVKDKLTYPDDALKNRIEGTVHLRYSINRYGKTFNIKVVKGLSPGCNEEAKRIISLFNFKMPKNRAGKVIFHKTIQIHFRLPKEKKQEVRNNHLQDNSSQMTYSYTLTSKSKSKKKQAIVYGYSISI